jgi:hypothetical protein
MWGLFAVLLSALVAATLTPPALSLPPIGSSSSPPLRTDLATDEIDWDAYRILDDEINISQSLDYVKMIPVHLYWDEYRGGFRTGVLGEKIIGTFPQFVTYSLIKNATKGPFSLINVTTIDTNTLFMHLFLVVKFMTQKSIDITQTILPLRTQFHEIEQKLSLWQNLTGEDWKTAAQLRVEYVEKEIELETIGKRIELTQARTSTRLAMLRDYYQVTRIPLC